MSNDHLYRIDSDLEVRESVKPGRRVLNFILKVVAVSLVVTVVVYLVIAVAVNTDVEGRLKRENKMFEKLYPELLPQQQLLEDAISNLEIKDNEVYEAIFHSSAPSADPINSLCLLSGGDSIPNTSLIAYSSAKSDRMMEDAYAVELALRQALCKLANPATVLPPMHLPVKNISFTQVGASVGEKIQPYLKAYVQHDGLDFIVSQGEPVYASAAGKVSSVEKSSKGKGNTVTITHPGGYVTRYSHLSTMKVKQGQNVKLGQQIGTVGATGNAFAPHLHYEVLLNGRIMDPVNYIFASVDYEEYSNMLYMAVNTAQSLD